MGVAGGSIKVICIACLWFFFLFDYVDGSFNIDLVWNLRVMDVLAYPSLPMQLPQQK